MRRLRAESLSLPLRMLLLAGAAFTSPLWAASIDGRYQTVNDGTVSQLELRSEGTRVSGGLQEGRLVLTLSGELRGNTLQLQMQDPASGRVIGTLNGPVRDQVFDATATVTDPNSGQSQQRRARFTREGAPTAAAKPGKTVPAGTLDTRIVGTWVHDDVINSPGGVGTASFATRRTLVLGADGQVEQWVESAGSGGNWSYGGGRKTEFSGQWSTRDGTLLLRAAGQSEFTPATRYRLSDRYLVLESPGKKMILQRR